MPLVSVIVPTYNRAHLITDALDSVYLQTHRPIQLIVVDDGSIDDTKDVVAAWRQKHTDNQFEFNYLMQDNQGGNTARNTGIRAAEGDYIGFLDSDDCWHSSKVTKQIETIEANQEYGAVYCGVQHVDATTGKLLEPTNRKYPEGFILDQLLVQDITAPTSSYLIRKEVFDNVGVFDTGLAARQDWDMWIRIASQYKIGVVAQPLVDFREHPGPRTATNPQREIDAYIYILDKYASIRKTRPLAVRLAAKASFYRRMGRIHFHHKSLRIKPLVYYMMAIAIWPFDFDSYSALGGWFLPRQLRTKLHQQWNKRFGDSILSIRSH